MGSIISARRKVRAHREPTKSEDERVFDLWLNPQFDAVPNNLFGVDRARQLLYLYEERMDSTDLDQRRHLVEMKTIYLIKNLRLAGF
jgi:hypothetical protein